MTRKLLLDVDPGLDDALAMYMALGSDAVDVVGVTTVMGNTAIEHTTHNALSLLEFVGRSDVPVAKGAAKPFADELTMAEYIHGEGGIPAPIRDRLPEPTTDPVGDHAADFIVDQARKHDDLTIAAVGPQTNVALAIAKEPELPSLVDGIYQMGGALKTTGNVTPQASFNFYVDAPAAARVVQDGYPHVVGLDVTEPAYVPSKVVDRFDGQNEYRQVVSDILRLKADNETGSFGFDGTVASDSVVLAGILDDVLTFEDAYVAVDTTSGPSNGATIYDEHGVYGEEPNCKAAVDVDPDRCRDVIVESLERLG
ncbi:nucleoside hydrolase [Halegenticoccus tardaugens]|uniref:nucleoside hydrolase n=1 Tax=Halegenticoccus tardaugens TaxID=2071624 RepID=UPI00100B2769|nr:nucleoside hydrolase [Halegenticoccus tardaugens]